MATSNRLRDTASDYNDIYNNPDARFGVENPRVSRGNQEQSLTSRPSEDGRRGRISPRRYRGPQESDEFVDQVSRREQMIEQRYIADVQQLAEPANMNSAPQKVKVHTSAFARARGITFGIVTLSWLVPVYFFWQLPISIVGAIMLGLSLQVESDTLLSAIDTAAQTFGSLFGYEYFDLAGAGMLATITVAAFGVVAACVAGFTAILWGLHPLSGNAAGTKKVTFIVGVVGACLPFANMFPWIIFWVLVMMRHPK
jgi:hypothetical protein